VYTTNE